MNTPLYPIRAVSNLTGISVDTLRAWERRHRVVAPQRDDHGRLYTEADVLRLRLLKAAVDKGHAISRLATLGIEELQALDHRVHAKANGEMETRFTSLDIFPLVLSSMIASIEQLQYAEVERELSRLAAILSAQDLVHHIALPLLREVGRAWEQGRLSVAHEHLTSSLLRSLLGATISLYRRNSPGGMLVFATPSGERHEFGILLAATLAAGGGAGILYLGPDLPSDEILHVAQKTAPQAVVLGLIGAEDANGGFLEVKKIAQKLPAKIELWVGGPREEALINKLEKTRALLIDDFKMLEQHLVRLGARF
jgi:DNA-binding transcriptional MerR regulator